MAIFYIAYDLDKPGQNYDDLWRELDSLGAKRMQDSVWCLKSASDKKTIFDTIRQHMDDNDRLLVVKSGGSQFIKAMFDPNDL